MGDEARAEKMRKAPRLEKHKSRPRLDKTGIEQKYANSLESFSSSLSKFDMVLGTGEGTDYVVEVKKGPFVKKDLLEQLKKYWKTAVIELPAIGQVNLVKVLDSADYIESQSNALLQELKESEKKGELDSGQAKELQKPLVQAAKEAAEVKDALGGGGDGGVPPDDTSEELTDYYTALSDTQANSNNLKAIAEVLDREIPEDMEKEQGLLSRIWNRIKGLVASIREKVSRLVKRIKGIASQTGAIFLETLDKLEEAFNKGIQKAREVVEDAFRTLADKFQNFAVTLIEKMLRFLSRFGTIVEDKGFAISKIEITIPKINYEFVSLFGIPLPIPKIDPPDMKVTIEPKKQADLKTKTKQL